MDDDTVLKIWRSVLLAVVSIVFILAVACESRERNYIEAGFCPIMERYGTRSDFYRETWQKCSTLPSPPKAEGV